MIGLALLVISSIPVTRPVEVINTSFTVSPENDFETYYHTNLFGESVLKGEVIVEGEGIYLAAHGYNTLHLNNIYIEERYTFTVDPADDLYNFIFDNAEGDSESSVRFTLEEIWTGPISISSHLGFIAWLVGFFLFLAGLIALAVSRFRPRKK